MKIHIAASFPFRGSFPKPDRKIKDLNPINKISKARAKRIADGDGERPLFEQIAKERPHICFVTRRRVNVYKKDGSLDVRCFVHVVSKGSRPDLRLLKENIQIALPMVHTIYDRGNERERKEMEKYEGWGKLLELHDKIIEENK